MRLPVIEGIIRRRILANFSADPAIVARMLPAPLRPKLAGDRAVVGICLIRLEQIRPRHFPAALEISSENAAHRFAVTWTDSEGRAREGVYIPRRDTDSMMNHLAGGRLFPGEHHHAEFTVHDDGVAIDLAMRANDGGVSVQGASATGFTSSLFSSLEDASDFFRGGSLGYSTWQSLSGASHPPVAFNSSISFGIGGARGRTRRRAHRGKRSLDGAPLRPATPALRRDRDRDRREEHSARPGA